MVRYTVVGSAAYDDDPENRFLEQYDDDIRSAAKIVVPRDLFPEEVLDMEVDEVAQNMRFKIWQALRNNTVIENPRAYIRKVAFTSAIDTRRSHKHTTPLPLDEYGELCQSRFLESASEADPASIYQTNEMVEEYMAWLTHALPILPQQQRLAMIFHVAELLDDVHPFLRALQACGFDTEAINWPEEKQAAIRLKASVSPGREKLRRLRTETELVV